MTHGWQPSRPWSALAGVGATIVVLAAMTSMWLVVWRAPRDLPLTATRFWIDYVAPRALVVFGLLLPMLVLGAAAAWMIIRRGSVRRTPDRTSSVLFPSRGLATLHLIAIGCLIVSFVAVAVLMVTRSQSSLAPVAVLGPGALAVLIEGQVVERVARRRAALDGSAIWLERGRVQRELVSVSAAVSALRVVRDIEPPDLP